MIKTRIFIHAAQILAAFLCLISLASNCRAFAYRPAEPPNILSEYRAPNNPAPRHSGVWKVIPEACADGTATLRFFAEAATGENSVCIVSLPSLVSGGDIVWRKTGENTEKRSSTGLLLVPGFPAPCDILPVGGKDNGRVYRERSEAGGRVFIRKYRVVIETFSIAAATAEGWIRVETPDLLELVMVTVTDEKGRPAVRQLWPVGGSWWLYEETPFRRSWLID